MPFSLPAASKFFFPNIIFRLVRSNLPPHQAVFRVPPQLTKPDIKHYLETVYPPVTITDVRTMNYHGRLRADTKRMGAQSKQSANWKKVIVTMQEDFVWPDPPKVKTGSGADEDGAERFPQRNSRPVGKGSHSKFRYKPKDGAKPESDKQ
ncbi:hypothetical protein HK102_013896 [Quaeritorhiza haematococci]|nr:hypothetical protein HK102_013896 [Quaeritorhiza haematococci]